MAKLMDNMPAKSQTVVQSMPAWACLRVMQRVMTQSMAPSMAAEVKGTRPVAMQMMTRK